MLFGIAFAGAVFSIVRDFNEGLLKKHFFHWTRFMYYCMFFTIVMRDTEWYPFMINLFAPLSLNVYAVYYYRMTVPTRELLSAESYAVHLIMPMIAMYLWFEDMTFISIYFSIWYLVPIAVYVAQQYLYLWIYKEDFYNFPILSEEGVMKFFGTFAGAFVLFYTRYLLIVWWMFIPWYVPDIVAVAMFLGATANIFTDILKMAKKALF